MGTFSLSSPAFERGSEIPRKYGYKHGNASPPLTVRGIPDGCKSIALIMDDPDAMGAVGKVWVHWVVWNIPPGSCDFGESSIPGGAVEGTTDFGKTGYGGPAPPDTRHTYMFKLCALDSVLELERGATKRQLEEAMKNRVIGETRLEGTFAP